MKKGNEITYLSEIIFGNIIQIYVREIIVAYCVECYIGKTSLEYRSCTFAVSEKSAWLRGSAGE